MTCLTLTQPWATLVAIGAKCIETRSWSTRYRGPLAIHAAATFGKGGKRGYFSRCRSAPFKAALEPHLRYFDIYNCFAAPMGAIVATCELVDVRPIPTSLPAWMAYSTHEERWELNAQEIAFGDYTPGRFA